MMKHEAEPVHEWNAEAHAAVLRERERLDPGWFARLREIPAFKELVRLGVEEHVLLEMVAYGRAGIGVHQISANSTRLSAVAQQARALARELERLPVFMRMCGGSREGRPEQRQVFDLLAGGVADAGIKAATLADSLDLPSVAALFNLADPGRPLVASLKELARLCAKVRRTVAGESRKLEFGKLYLARQLADLARDRTGKHHYRLVAAIYSYTFEIDPALDEQSFRVIANRARGASVKARREA
jgi:hypothetical protein